MKGKSGIRLDSIELITVKGRQFGPWGGSGGGEFVAARPKCKLVYLSGNAGQVVDGITLHWQC